MQTRILHVTETLNRGGMERVIVDLAIEQRLQGSVCEVLCLYSGGVLAAELEAAGIRVIVLGKSDGLDFASLRRLRKIVRDGSFDVVHTHNPVANYLSAFACIALTKPIIVSTRHGMGASKGLNRRERLYRLSTKFTDACVTVCNAAGTIFVERGIIPKNKLRVIKNGIALSAAAPAEQDPSGYSSKSPGPDRPFVFGTVGRLNRIKRQDFLVDCFARVAEMFPNVQLALVGGGSEQKKIEKLIQSYDLQKRITLLGDREDARDLLTGFDVFLLSSISEGYSIALLEACDAGLPIVATDVGGNPEIVVQGVNGYIVPPDDKDQFVKRMAQLYKDQQKREAMSDQSRMWAEQHAGLTSMVDQYNSLYRQLMSP